MSGATGLRVQLIRKSWRTRISSCSFYTTSSNYTNKKYSGVVVDGFSICLRMSDQICPVPITMNSQYLVAAVLLCPLITTYEQKILQHGCRWVQHPSEIVTSDHTALLNTDHNELTNNMQSSRGCGWSSHRITLGPSH